MVQSLDAVRHAAAGGEHQNRRFNTVPAQLLQYGKTVPSRQHDVQNDEVVQPGEAVVQAAVTVKGQVGGIALLFQKALQALRHALLILHDQKPHTRTSKGKKKKFTTNYYNKSTVVFPDKMCKKTGAGGVPAPWKTFIP